MRHDEDITNITEEQLRRTFQTNIFGMFFLTQAAMPHLSEGSAIVNCTSETMYNPPMSSRGPPFPCWKANYH